MQEAANALGLVFYNPPHAKRVLSADRIGKLAAAIPNLVGVKVAGGNEAWYAIGTKLRWPYRSVEEDEANGLRPILRSLVPELLEGVLS